jgi:hypothetical protein
VVPDKNHKAVGWSCSFARGLAAGPQFKVGLFPKILELEFGVTNQSFSSSAPSVIPLCSMSTGSLAGFGRAWLPQGWQNRLRGSDRCCAKLVRALLGCQTQDSLYF